VRTDDVAAVAVIGANVSARVRRTSLVQLPKNLHLLQDSREPSGWELARGLRGTMFRDRFKRSEEDFCLIAAEDPIQNIQARLLVEKRACDFPVR